MSVLKEVIINTYKHLLEAEKQNSKDIENCIAQKGGKGKGRRPLRLRGNESRLHEDIGALDAIIKQSDLRD